MIVDGKIKKQFAEIIVEYFSLNKIYSNKSKKKKKKNSIHILKDTFIDFHMLKKVKNSKEEKKEECLATFTTTQHLRTANTPP